MVGDPPFTHLPPPGQPVTRIGTLELTTALGFDIGLFLLVLGSLVVLIQHLNDLISDGQAGLHGQADPDGHASPDGRSGLDGQSGLDGASANREGGRGWDGTG
jgi:hypothetical protein